MGGDCVVAQLVDYRPKTPEALSSTTQETVWLNMGYNSSTQGVQAEESPLQGHPHYIV